MREDVVKIRVKLNTELRVGRENIKQSACEFEVEVPAEVAEKISASMADLTTCLPYEHLVVTTCLVDDRGQVIAGGKVPIRG